MESDGENKELFSDEERETELTVLRVVKCTARQEEQWYDYFEEYSVAVNGYVYRPGVWRNAVARTGERCIHRRFGRRVNEEKIRKEKHERMERNEVTKFFFLVEEDRRAEAE